MISIDNLVNLNIFLGKIINEKIYKSRTYEKNFRKIYLPEFISKFIAVLY